MTEPDVDALLVEPGKEADALEALHLAVAQLKRAKAAKTHLPQVDAASLRSAITRRAQGGL